MTHAELRAQLRAYADGTLVEREAELVRAHLATGCLECLGTVFERPAGLPRPRPLELTAPTVVAVPLPRRRRRPWPALAGAVAVGAAVLATVAGRDRGRLADAPSVDDVARIRAERDALATELERAAREPARRDDPDRTPPAPAPPATVPPSTDHADTIPRWLGDFLGAADTTVAALEPAPFARAARGYVVWSPERNLIVVSAADLPVTDDGDYRLRIEMRDGTVVWVGKLTASPRGALTMTLALPGATGRRVVAVELYRDPPGAPALAARLRRTS